MKKNFLLKQVFRNDAWIFAGCIVFANIIYALSDSKQFGPFIQYTTISLIGFSSIIIYSWFKPEVIKRYGIRKNQLFWVLAFLVAPIFIFTINFSNVGFRSHGYSEELIPIIWGFLLTMEILLWSVKKVSTKIKKSTYLKKINLDKSLLAIVIFLGGFFGALATSNLDRYDGVSIPLSDFISFFEIMAHPLKFISFSAQFGIAFGVFYLLYYMNKNWLIQYLLKERGLLFYILGAIAVVTFMFPMAGFVLAHLPISQQYFSLLPSNNLNIMNEINFLVPFVFMLISSPVILVIDWFDQNNKLTSLAKEKAEKELDFLKQQINPHFFFNTLNNLYALSLQESKQTPEVIMQLSDLMRYVIYKGKEDYVTVGEELEYVMDYIQLQRLRHHKELDFSFENNLTDTSIPVPPLLYIVLVENAFKHGVEKSEEQAFIRMAIENDDDNLFFSIHNSFDHSVGHSAGIGLENLQRRLDLIYPDQYSLDISEDTGIFSVQLNLYTT